MSIEFHFEKHINNLNVIREPDTKHRREYLTVTLFSGLFLLCLLFYGWQRYQWIQYGYHIEAAQKKKEQLLEQGRQLRLERASLRNPQRIDAIARSELGMVVPAPGQLVTLSADAPMTIPNTRQPQQPHGDGEQLAARR
jgi:cell division protein FtsL